MNVPTSKYVSSSELKREGSVASAYLCVLALYFLLHLLLRLNLSSTLELDEAEQAFLYPRMSFGYGTQPPLYTWLQWLMFKTFGVNLFALSALKNLILFGTYFLMFQLARPMVGISGAIAASASMLLLPTIGWESQRDLTHSVLLTFFACAALGSYFALVRKPSVLRYVVFGAMLGLGMQTKYNFAVFIFGLAGASLLVVEHRRVVWQPRLSIAVVTALACFLPHGIWLLTHLDVAMQGTVAKMMQGEDAGYIGNVLRGVGSIALATLGFLTPLWLIYGWLCRRDMRAAYIDWKNPVGRFFLILYAGFFILLVALVIEGEVWSIKSRWMLPLLFSAPLGFMVIFPSLSTPGFHRRVLLSAACGAVVILIALPARTHIGTFIGRPTQAHQLYPQLSAEIESLFPNVRTLVVEDKVIAGNLYFQRPIRRTLLLEDTLQAKEPIDENVLLVLRSDMEPGWLQRFQVRYPRMAVLQQGKLNLSKLYGNPESLTFQYAHLGIRNR